MKALLLALLLAGCARAVWVEPVTLPFPEAPEITFRLEQGSVCLSQQDAHRLGLYFDQLNAFRHAWERLREPTR